MKASVEIWKEEWFEDGGMWRSNRDGQAGIPVNGQDANKSSTTRTNSFTTDSGTI